MKHYSVTPKIRALMAQDIARVKTAIAMLANASLGVETIAQGIYKYEGGIVVDGCEIAIKNQHVRDDWVHHRDPSPEELATAKAIEHVAAGIEAEGITYVENYEPCMTGDPLRDLMKAP